MATDGACIPPGLHAPSRHRCSENLSLSVELGTTTARTVVVFNTMLPLFSPVLNREILFVCRIHTLKTQNHTHTPTCTHKVSTCQGVKERSERSDAALRSPKFSGLWNVTRNSVPISDSSLIVLSGPFKHIVNKEPADPPWIAPSNYHSCGGPYFLHTRSRGGKSVEAVAF
jgi:hypothetical protein